MRRPRLALAAVNLASCLLLAPAAVAAPQISEAVPDAYTLDLAFTAAGGGRLSGTETIRFTNRGPGAIERVYLRLWANGPDRCRKQRIRVAVGAPAVAETLRVGCSVLPVRLGAPLAPGESGALALSLDVRGRSAEDRFGRIGRARLFGNVIPVLAVRDERGLHLEPYSATGESFYSLAAPWEATVRAPRRMRIASTGAVLSEAVAGPTRTVTASTAAARDFALAFGTFRVLRGSAAGVAVRVFANDRRKGRGMLRAAKKGIRVFTRRFGAYGSPELDVVQIDPSFPFGMEYPEVVFSDPRAWIVVHEVAHQWWYGIVGDDQAASPWLDESLTSYSDSLAAGGFANCDLRRPFSILPRRWRRLRLDSPMSYWNRHPAQYDAVVYVVGACVMRSLERSIGPRRMTAFLRLLVSRHRFGVIDKADFLAALAEAAPPGFRTGSFLRRAHISG